MAILSPFKQLLWQYLKNMSLWLPPTFLLIHHSQSTHPTTPILIFIPLLDGKMFSTCLGEFVKWLNQRMVHCPIFYISSHKTKMSCCLVKAEQKSRPFSQPIFSVFFWKEVTKQMDKTVNKTLYKLSEISVSHGGINKDDSLLWCYTV